MADDITERFFTWMEAHNIKRSSAAEMLDVDERSLSTYRSRGLPQKKHALAERLMALPNPAEATPAGEDNRLNILLNDEEFELVQRAAMIVQTPFKQFILRAAIAKAQEEIRKERAGSYLKVAEDPAPYPAPPKGKSSGSTSA